MGIKNMRKLYVVTMFTVLAIFAVLPHVQASEHILAEYSTVAEGEDYLFIAAVHPAAEADEYSAVAYNFTTDADQWQITTLSVYAKRTGTLDGYLTARFYLPDGNIPDESAVVAESTPLAAASISDSAAEWVNFTFANPVLDAETEYYWGVIGLNGTWVLSTQQVTFYGNMTGDDPHGWDYEDWGDGGLWSDYESYYLGFIVYGDEYVPAVPTVPTWHDMNSAVVTVAEVVLPILYLVGSALWFVRTEKKPDAQDIIVLAVGLLAVAVIFPLGMTALLA